MQNLLFICAQNRLRSPTAEHCFAEWPGIATDSAGLDVDAIVHLSANQINWADIIFVMEPKQKLKVLKLYKPQIGNKPVICLNIPDVYERMQPELIAILNSKVPTFLNSKCQP